MACGRDESGLPNSTATLAVNQIESEDVAHTLSQIIISNADFQMYISGGAAAIQMDFRLAETFEYNRAIAICSEWLQNLNNPEYDNQHLSLVVTPTVLCGEIFFMFTNLIYFMGVNIENGYRLVLVFDNNESELYTTDEVDYKAMEAAIEAELRHEEDELDNQILAIEKELKEARAQNPYAEAIQARQDALIRGETDDEDDDDEDEDDDDGDGDHPTHRFVD
jgi:PHD/YefM family antitoxin component YafN of YafNO toxin-antitoxin module